MVRKVGGVWNDRGGPRKLATAMQETPAVGQKDRGRWGVQGRFLSPFSSLAAVSTPAHGALAGLSSFATRAPATSVRASGTESPPPAKNE